MDMTYEQFEELLDRHGPLLEAWPPAERAAARQLLLGDADAARAMDAASVVSAALDVYHVDTPDLSARIMAAVPGSRGDQLLAWLFPGGSASVLRPMLAGALPLLMGLAVGLSMPPLADDEAAQWEYEERALLGAPTADLWDE